MPSYMGPVSVPQDVITQTAYQLINDVASGGDGSSVLFSLDAQTKQAVCQRASDLLSLPPCSQVSGGSTFSAAKGNCADDSQNPVAWQHPYSQLYPGVIKACQAAGLTVQEEMPLVVGEAGVGLLLGAIAGGFLGHHFGGHAIVGVIAGAIGGTFLGVGLYSIQAARVPVQAQS